MNEAPSAMMWMASFFVSIALHSNARSAGSAVDAFGAMGYYWLPIFAALLHKSGAGQEAFQTGRVRPSDLVSMLPGLT